MAGLRQNDQHLIVRDITPTNFIEQRWKLRELDGYICHADDDDLIEPAALAKCVEAIERTGAGCAFTDESVEEQDGTIVLVNQGERRWLDFMLSPQKIHHLVVFNPRLVPTSALELATSAGIGIDWLMKAGAGVFGGAVHVPMVGYHWIQRSGQMSKVNHATHTANHARFSRLIDSWLKQAGRDMFETIPCYR